MTQPARTLTKCSDGKATSIFPSGNKPSGNLVYSNLTNPGVTPVHGDLVAICTNFYSFGTVGPKLVMRMDLKNATIGDITNPTSIIQTNAYTNGVAYNNPNSGTSDGQFKVQADAALPYGKAVAVGQPSSTSAGTFAPNVKVVSKTEDTETFTHTVYHFPTANQDNFFVQVQVSGDTNQGIKWNWHTYLTGSSTSGQDIDAFFAGFRVSGSQPSVIADKEYIANSNDPGLTIALLTAKTQSALDPSNTNRWRPNPIIKQNYIKIATSGKAETKLLDTTTGVIYGFSDNSVSQNTAVATFNNTFDTYYLNAQCNGFYLDLNANYFVGEMVTYMGPGCTCRVTITDVAGAGAVGSGQKLETICEPKSWGDDTVVVQIVEGMFAGQSLAGKYFNLWKAGNSYVASTGAIQ